MQKKEAEDNGPPQFPFKHRLISLKFLKDRMIHLLIWDSKTQWCMAVTKVWCSSNTWVHHNNNLWTQICICKCNSRWWIRECKVEDIHRVWWECHLHNSLSCKIRWWCKVNSSRNKCHKEFKWWISKWWEWICDHKCMILIWWINFSRCKCKVDIQECISKWVHQCINNNNGLSSILRDKIALLTNKIPFLHFNNHQLIFRVSPLLSSNHQQIMWMMKMQPNHGLLVETHWLSNLAASSF